MKIFGQHEPTTLSQFENVRGRAVDAALMADGHVGYVMPIGGVAAYRERVSVVGVGFDIACIAAGTPVLLADGMHVPIETVTDLSGGVCWDGQRVRRIHPLVGAIPRGVRPVVRLTLANGRTLVATVDHRLRTRDGWTAIGDLAPSRDRVACTVHLGVPHEAWDATVLHDIDDPAADELWEMVLLPLVGGDPRVAPLMRLLGVVSGDGHLSRDGRSVSVYTTVAEDAEEIRADFGRLGFRGSVYRRPRAGRQDALCVRVHSRALHLLLCTLGTPVGHKAWPADPMPWLMGAPAWARAGFLSGLASAEMTTPRIHANGVVPNLQLKQAGETDNAIRFAARLFESLGFATSVATSGPPYGGRQSWVMQLLGGREAQVAFAERVGFCHAIGKRHAAARVASVVWQSRRETRIRREARDEARALHLAGAGWRDVVRDVSIRRGDTTGFVFHAIYSERGEPRAGSGAMVADVSGEVCWIGIDSIEPCGESAVYDVVTGDTAASFVAGGIVVHNCGNAAIRTDLTLASLGDDPERVQETLRGFADDIAESVSFGVGRKNRANDAPVDHPLFEEAAWDAVPPKHRAALRAKAREQLGTVGSGNHYVDLFADESGTVWIGVHFGSRGFGHTVASAYLALSQGKEWGDRVPETEALLGLGDPIGHDYWALMNLAGRYAYAGREWVARKVVAMLGGTEMELVHNHHNFAWKETHAGEEVVVVRKGATPAFPGQLGFIGGSMGDDAVIVRGTLAPSADVAATQRASLYSTVHGAGRVMSRTAAAGKRNRRTGRQLSRGAISPGMMQDWVREKGVILRGGGVDESPHVYRRLPDVLSAQEGTIEILHTLRPLVVVMAGENEFDPYKD